MSNLQSAPVHEAVEREIARTTYPDAFPALPEVPAGRYYDPQFYELEQQYLWRKTWLHAGHVSELPTVGSYKLFEQLGLSIIISRGLDGEIRAFHNICRHRASALLLEKKKKSKKDGENHHHHHHHRHHEDDEQKSGATSARQPAEEPVEAAEAAKAEAVEEQKE